MRLAVEVTTCTPERTGIGYYTEHVVDALLATRAPGDDLVLLSNRPPAAALAERWARHLRVSGPSVRAAWMQAAVPGLLADARADVGVFPNYAVPLAPPCPTIAVVHDLAVLRMPEHSTLQKRLLMEPMLRQVARTASVVATVSEASRRDIVERLGVPVGRTLVLHGAAHPSCRPASVARVAEVRARYGLARPYLLTVGTLEPRKDLLTLLRAFDRLRARGETRDLVVVGGRGWKDRGIVKALEERAPRGVRWLGYVGEADLAALYTGADLFVLSPVLEGFGLPLLEAMACGATVVASDVAALREVGGDVARYVAPRDVNGFADAIAEEIADGPGLADRRARGLVRARAFSWEKTAEALWERARASAPARVTAVTASRRANVGALPAPAGPPPAALTHEEWSLLAGVVYADLFDSPLPVEHAALTALGVSLDERRVRALAGGRSLSRLVTLDARGFLVLTGREALLDRLPEREQMTRELLAAHTRTLGALARLPFVRGLVVSGGVAHRNVAARADIDLFVIAARGRAFTAYTMLFLATTLTRTRHVICPNYLVDESELAVAYHRDLFTAHQLAAARSLSGHPAYEALCAANEAWVREFFPGFTPQPAMSGGGRGSERVQAGAERALAPVGDAIEAALRWGWRFRLRRRAAAAKHSDVVLANGIMKLHLSDYRVRVLGRFAARLDALREPDAAPSYAVPADPGRDLRA